jgi:excisionase family DNA binding protein
MIKMIAVSEITIDDAGEDLLQRYLSLPEIQREKEFLSTRGAAKRVGLSTRTIQLWIEGEKIKAISIGKKYKVCLRSLLSYIENSMQEH